MDPRRLEMLLELSRLGSMAAVADVMHTTTSTVSQQLSVLAREAGVALVEPDGRRVRLTPAGRRLADHAVTVLGALEAARADLDPSASPSGVVRVASFASAVRHRVLPVVRRLAEEHPQVRLVVREHEPGEARALLRDDEVDLALGYEYNLAPAADDPVFDASPLYGTRWGLGVPAADACGPASAAAVFRRFRDREWIVNSRNTADDEVLRVLGSLAGFAPHISHRADSLDLVADMIAAGLGVGLLPLGFESARAADVAVLPIREPDLLLRAFTLTRRGRAAWPPLALVLRLLEG